MVSTVEVLFDKAAQDYDRARRQLVPCFDELYGTVLGLLPFERRAGVRILDLGAGTGLLSALVAEALPNARITLVDFSEAMLKKARLRFASEPARFDFEVMDYAKEPLVGEYDAVISALSIHHLDDGEKRKLFRKVREILPEGGVFVNADQVLGTTPEIEGRYHEWWLHEAREAGVSEYDLAASLERIEQDKNATLKSQLAWLEEAGFEEVDCPYKNHRFAVYGGRKSRKTVPIDTRAYDGEDSTDG
ncbi:MAG: methyltransferase domain-containing protein [Rubrobacter sp.]|nr:methyltransferase domain-containing protein [Rubrobacter sp.]